MWDLIWGNFVLPGLASLVNNCKSQRVACTGKERERRGQKTERQREEEGEREMCVRERGVRRKRERGTERERGKEWHFPVRGESELHSQVKGQIGNMYRSRGLSVPCAAREGSLKDQALSSVPLATPSHKDKPSVRKGKLLQSTEGKEIPVASFPHSLTLLGADCVFIYSANLSEDLCRKAESGPKRKRKWTLL